MGSVKLRRDPWGLHLQTFSSPEVLRRGYNVSHEYVLFNNFMKIIVKENSKGFPNKRRRPDCIRSLSDRYHKSVYFLSCSSAERGRLDEKETIKDDVTVIGRLIDSVFMFTVRTQEDEGFRCVG